MSEEMVDFDAESNGCIEVGTEEEEVNSVNRQGDNELALLGDVRDIDWEIKIADRLPKMYHSVKDEITILKSVRRTVHSPIQFMPFSFERHINLFVFIVNIRLYFSGLKFV